MAGTAAVADAGGAAGRIATNRARDARDAVPRRRATQPEIVHKTSGKQGVMSAMMQTHEPSRDKPSRRWAGSWSLGPQFWAAVAIVAMWLAVLFDGVFGGKMTFTSSPTNFTTMPSAVAVALFAAIGTSAVAKRAFGRKGPKNGRSSAASTVRRMI